MAITLSASTTAFEVLKGHDDVMQTRSIWGSGEPAWVNAHTWALLDAVPVPDPSVEAGRRFRPVKGEVPSPINPPSGCVFHPRCPIAVESCSRMRPELREVRLGHWVACSEVR